MDVVQDPDCGEGCPGASAGAAVEEGLCGLTRLACGRVVDGWGGLSVFSPRIPSICGATVTGTSGADLLSYPVFPDASR